ncbi:MAG TPA: DUF1501 domain-containing protein [Candidatus Acidoferrum sp.]|nr:DUF1501 domain-containing protein [Candidatus Acidoferrum sp.]
MHNRRDFLMRSGSGLSALALSSLLQAADNKDPLAPRPPDHAPTAKSVIWLFMEGGPSHIDLFDPKPEIQRLAGQPLPPSYGKVVTAMGTGSNTLMPSTRSFKQYGQSGMWVSDLYPQIAEHVDDLTMFRSCKADGLNHVGSVCQMNTGSILAGRPSMGSWVTYGLGTANRNLPSFVILTDAGEVLGGAKNWSSGFLPATYEGTLFRREGAPILDLAPPTSIGEGQQRGRLDLLRSLNQHYGARHPGDNELDARLESFELAYRMQAAAPEAVDLTRESEATRKLYGMDNEVTAKFGANCLLARRMVERGVRFVELYSGSGSGWDAHNDLDKNHARHCLETDVPIAGLLTDLKARGLLDSTLVVWGGEFGRTPFNEKGNGRDHNPWGFTMWMAGGGMKPGTVIGRTDDLGLRAVERPVHVHDIHATILWCLGLDHVRVTYLHNGRSERPTIVSGEVVKEALG